MQTLKRPFRFSELTCHEPKLIQVKSKCCREWSCQKMEASGMAGLVQGRGLHSENLVIQDPPYYQAATPPWLEQPIKLATSSYKVCDQKTTDWTPCPVTCDVGVSTRTVVDPVTCNTFQELQLCYLRPCGLSNATLGTLGREKCTPTTRSPRRLHIYFQDCMSIKDYNLKFCTNCKHNKCCYPHRTSNRLMEFECSDGKRELYNYMWLKKCRCEDTCDPRQNQQHKRHKRRRQERRKDEENQRRRRHK
ncbi:hypothetical protein BsWGS_23162 [Bradybaena similaris]